MTTQTLAINTLTYDAERCIGCGLCSMVCPHAVFQQPGRRAELVRGEACIECGACMLNCPVGAIQVDKGTGCFVAMMRAALFGGEVTCGPSDGCGCGENSGKSSCC
jgi:ferredoxin